MKIICMSDNHGKLPEIKQTIDTVLIAGDTCLHGDPYLDSNWIQDKLNVWLDSISAENKVMISGNHDIIFTQTFKNLRPKLKCHYLEDEEIVIDGIKIYGSPWTVRFGLWAFMKPDNELATVWAKIPDDTDVLLLHGPPYGIGDVSKYGYGANLGSLTLINRIYEIKPRLVVFGHIHHGYGIYAVDTNSDIGNRKIEKIETDNLIIPKKSDKIYFINASLLDDDYKFVNKPIILELE